MKLKDLIILLASIDNVQNIPQRELMDWDVQLTNVYGDEMFIGAVYCNESKKKIYIDVDES